MVTKIELQRIMTWMAKRKDTTDWPEGGAATIGRALVAAGQQIVEKQDEAKRAKRDASIMRWCNVVVAVALLVMAVVQVAKAEERIEREVKCLALNVYHEARSEPEMGQQMVAAVTLHRARATGRSVCRTVYAPHQFSWTDLPRERQRVLEPGAWHRAMLVAKQAYFRQHILGLEPPLMASHFHTLDVRPSWAAALTHVATIGRHRFYA